MPLMLAAAGAVVSTVTVKVEDALPLLPAGSTALAVRLCAPAVSVFASSQAPAPSAVTVPIVLAPSFTVTVALASLLPLIVSTVLLVMPSLADLPLSGVMPLIEVTGATVSTVIVMLPAAPELPAMSVAVAVRLWAPLPKTLANVQAPAPLAVTVPSVLLPSLTVIAAFASALPDRVSVPLLVMPSLPELPLSGVMPAITGAAGAVVSTVTAKAADALPLLPATSVAVAVRLCAPAASVLASVQAPAPSAVTVPSVVALSFTRTAALASALPEMVSAVLLVMPSAAERP